MTTQNNAAALAPETPNEAVLGQIVMGAFTSQAVYVAAKLGIADLVKDNPRPVAELAAETNTDANALYRVLRALASIGVFTETEPKTFALTPFAEPLLSDRAGSMRDMAIWIGEEAHWRVYGEMLYSVQTGKTAWGRVHGEEVFPYLFQTNPALGDIFNRAMTSFSSSVAPAVAQAYDTSGIETLVDVAGGQGLLLSAFLKANPNLKGVLFDLPAVIESAGALLESEGVAERVETVTGDFFASVPAGGDAYMMKHIIHDWDDERSLAILKNIHSAMNENGRVLIVEMVVREGNEPDFSKIMDLEMLVSPGGVERTAEEYRELLSRAGFRLTRIVPTASPYSIVEAVKA
ncbi:MAG TPA: methyltransferase [Pyrinomonadaceae bacterium]|jgi:hypothetical protein